MKIRIHHRTAYTYETPVGSVIQILRLTPRNYEGQTVRYWRIDLDHDALLQKSEDAFGNIVHTLSLTDPLDNLAVTVDGEIETHDTNGVVQGAYERFPPSLFLRETDLTKADGAITDFAAKTVGAGNTLERLHKLVDAVYNEIKFDVGPTDASTTAAEAFEHRHGVCQDLSHIFIAAARSLGIPARYIGGHMLREDGELQQEAGHAWSEAYVEDLGWVAFDPAHGISTTEAYVRVAVGLDYLGAAPVRGSRLGGAHEKLEVSVTVDHAGRQQQ